MNKGYNEASAFPRKIASKTTISFANPLSVVDAKYIHGIVLIGSPYGTISMSMYCADWGTKYFRVVSNTPLYIPGFAIKSILSIYSTYAESTAVVFYS